MQTHCRNVGDYVVYDDSDGDDDAEYSAGNLMNLIITFFHVWRAITMH